MILSPSQTDSSTNSSLKIQLFTKQTYLIHPLLSNYYLHYLFNHRLLHISLFLFCIFFAIYVNTFDKIDTLPGFICIFIICLFYFILFFTKVDRSLLNILLKRFEFYYLLFNMILYVTFGIWSRVHDLPLYALITPFYGFLLINIWISLLDTSPNFPPW